MTHIHGFWILSGIVTPPLPWVAYYNARPCFQWRIFFLIINLFILKIFIRYNICLSWSCPFWWTGLPTLIKAMRENLTKPISTTKYCLSKTVGLQASNISWKRKLLFFFFNLSENVSFLHSHKASVYFFWWVFCLWFSYFIFSGWVLLFSYFFFSGWVLLTLESKILHKKLWMLNIWPVLFTASETTFIQTPTREKGPLSRLWDLEGKFCSGPPAEYLSMAEVLGNILT